MIGSQLLIKHGHQFGNVIKAAKQFEIFSRLVCELKGLHSSEHLEKTLRYGRLAWKQIDDVDGLVGFWRVRHVLQNFAERRVVEQPAVPERLLLPANPKRGHREAGG